jgi:hypothetical protein
MLRKTLQLVLNVAAFTKRRSGLSVFARRHNTVITKTLIAFHTQPVTGPFGAFGANVRCEIHLQFSSYRSRYTALGAAGRPEDLVALPARAYRPVESTHQDLRRIYIANEIRTCRVQPYSVGTYTA